MPDHLTSIVERRVCRIVANRHGAAGHKLMRQAHDALQKDRPRCLPKISRRSGQRRVVRVVCAFQRGSCSGVPKKVLDIVGADFARREAGGDAIPSSPTSYREWEILPFWDNFSRRGSKFPLLERGLERMRLQTTRRGERPPACPLEEIFGGPALVLERVASKQHSGENVPRSMSSRLTPRQQTVTSAVGLRNIRPRPVWGPAAATGIS